MIRSEGLRKLGKALRGKALEGRVGHFCIGKRCRPARVTEQHGNKVDLMVITTAKHKTEQRDVPILKARDSARSFHELEQCDLIAIVDGEYTDVEAKDNG